MELIAIQNQILHKKSKSVTWCTISNDLGNDIGCRTVFSSAAMKTFQP